MIHVIRTITVALVVSLVWGCGGSGSSSSQIGGTIVTPPVGGVSVGNGKARLSDGFSCSEYRAYISTAIGDSYFENTNGPIELIIDPAPLATESDNAGGFVVSGTNNQEVGVDEADIIKADAQGIFYVARHDSLTVVKGYPAEQLDILAELDFDDSFRIKELALDEQANRLAVISYTNYVYPTTDSTNFLLHPQFGEASSIIKFFDVSDPTLPTEVNELRLSGYIQQTRLVDGQLLIIVQEDLFSAAQGYHYSSSHPELSQLISAYFDAVNDKDVDLANQLEQQARTYITDTIAQIDINEFLPTVDQWIDGAASPIDAIECTDIYKSEISVRLGLFSTYRLSLDGDYKDGLSAVVSPSSAAYVSDDNIYLYQRSSSWWWSENQVDESSIHQISFGVDSLDYQGAGIVPGSINGRFSLGEHNGYLRVATSETIVDTGLGTQTLTNRMQVLLPDDQGVLNIVGATETYGDGETIQSARFVQDKAYVVTFRQVDPLFSFDLSVPTSPKIIGELKIPGFSEYIHPVGTDRLITVGRNGNDDGLLPGVNFQLFDVSDLANPTLLHSYVPTDSSGNVTYSWSAASYESRAFTYIERENLLVVPFTINQYLSIDNNFAGFLAMEVNDADGFRELGRIDHEDLLPQDTCTTAAASTGDNCIIQGPYSWVAPLRSVVIEDSTNTLIYSLSNVGIQVNDIDSIEPSISGISF